MVLLEVLTSFYFFLYIIPPTTCATYQVAKSFDLRDATQLPLSRTSHGLRKRSFKDIAEGEEALKSTKDIDKSALHGKSTTEGLGTHEKLQVPSHGESPEERIADSDVAKGKGPQTPKKVVRFYPHDTEILGDSDFTQVESATQNIEEKPGASVSESFGTQNLRENTLHQSSPSEKQPSEYGIQAPPDDQKEFPHSQPVMETTSPAEEEDPKRSERGNQIFNKKASDDLGSANDVKTTEAHAKPDEDLDDGKYSQAELDVHSIDEIERARTKNKQSFQQLKESKFKLIIKSVKIKLEKGFKHSWNWFFNFVARRQRDPQTGRVPQAEGWLKRLLFKDAPNHRGETTAERLERLGRSGRVPPLKKPAQQVKPKPLSKAS